MTHVIHPPEPKEHVFWSYRISDSNGNEKLVFPEVYTILEATESVLELFGLSSDDLWGHWDYFQGAIETWDDYSFIFNEPYDGLVIDIERVYFDYAEYMELSLEDKLACLPNHWQATLSA